MTKFETYMLDRKGRSEATAKKYGEIAAKYLNGSLKVSGISPSRRTQIICAITSYGEYARGSAATKAARFIRGIPAPSRKASLPEFPLTQAEWSQLWKYFQDSPQPHRSVLLTLLYTPLRIGDVGRIRKEWILKAQHEGVLLVQPKGGKYRVFPWMIFKATIEPLLEAFPRWRKDEMIWQTRWKAEESFRQAMALHLRVGAAACGIKGKRIHLHLLRHTVAQQIADAGGLDAAQELLGHTSEKTTKGYLVPSRTLETFKKIDEKRMKGE